MRTKQGTDFVCLLYAKQKLKQKWINIDTQFLERAEGRFQDGRSRIKYFAISNNIYDMKTTLILNREYKKLQSATNILGDFCYVQFCYCTFGCTSKAQNRKLHRIQRAPDEVNSACLLAKQWSICVKWWQDTRFLFLLVFFFFQVL